MYGRPFNLYTGNPEGPEHVVNTYITGSQSHPKVGLSWGYDCIVVWQSDQDPQGGIFGQFYYGFTIPIFQEFRVNTTTAGVQGNRALVLTPQTVVVGWTSEQDPDGSLGVYGQLYGHPWLPVELQNFTIE